MPVQIAAITIVLVTLQQLHVRRVFITTLAVQLLVALCVMG